MISVSLAFRTAINFLMFLGLTTGCALWSYRCLKKEKQCSLAPFILSNLFLFILWGILVGINMDESEHLHCAWMVSQGLTPYTDFWQHHSPWLWITIAPLFKFLKPSVVIFDISRILSAGIFVLIGFLGWRIARKVWQEKANVSLYLLVLFSIGSYGQFCWVRPDLFMMVFLLIGIYCALAVPKRGSVALFLCGVSFSIAASYIFKQYLLFLLPILMIIVEKQTLQARVQKVAVYFAGLVVGVLPFMVYLIKKDILRDFIFWVFEFNKKRIVVSAVFPLAIAALGVWGATLLFARYRREQDKKSLVLFMAFCLTTLGSLTGTVNFSASYYLGFWCVMCAIVCSGCDLWGLVNRIPSLFKKSLLVGGFLSLLLTPNVMLAVRHKNSFFSKDKDLISQLLTYSKDESCLTLLPFHPVFCKDATRLYSYWYYYFAERFQSVREDATDYNIAEQLISSRPAVVVADISYEWNKARHFLVDLLMKELVTEDDFNRLSVFFEEQYSLVTIGNNIYYIRNDKVQ